jgi:hypothetical protein
VTVGRRALPALLALLAAAADSWGAHTLSFYVLLAAVPFAAVAGLLVFGDRLDRRDDAVLGFQSLMWALVVLLLVVSCAARSATVPYAVPPLAASALSACLGVFAVQAIVAAASRLRRLALRPAKP